MKWLFEFTHSQPLPPPTLGSPSQQRHIINIHTLTGDSVKGEREKRMAIGAAEMILQCVFDGCLSMQDMEIERRPYHRNCTCALHKLKGVCSNTCSQQSKISFPMKQSWTYYSLSPTPSKASYQSSPLDKSLVRNKYDANGALSYRKQSYSET